VKKERRDKKVEDISIKVRLKYNNIIEGINIIIDFILSYCVIGKRHNIKNENIFK
jgi:hypothetical protein